MREAPEPAAVGFSVHTGWAAAVAVSGAGGAPRVFARERIELAARELRFAYHRAAERPDRAGEIVEGAAAGARERAAAYLRRLGQELADRALVVALPRPRRPLPPLASILRAHPLLHAAEGELYRRSIAEAAAGLGLAVETPAPGALPELGRMGPPWGKDQRDAAALAWASLRGATAPDPRRGSSPPAPSRRE